MVVPAYPAGNTLWQGKRRPEAQSGRRMAQLQRWQTPLDQLDSLDSLADEALPTIPPSQKFEVAIDTYSPRRTESDSQSCTAKPSPGNMMQALHTGEAPKPICLQVANRVQPAVSVRAEGEDLPVDAVQSPRPDVTFQAAAKPIVCEKETAAAKPLVCESETSVATSGSEPFASLKLVEALTSQRGTCDSPQDLPLDSAGIAICTLLDHRNTRRRSRREATLDATLLSSKDGKKLHRSCSAKSAGSLDSKNCSRRESSGDTIVRPVLAAKSRIRPEFTRSRSAATAKTATNSLAARACSWGCLDDAMKNKGSAPTELTLARGKLTRVNSTDSNRSLTGDKDAANGRAGWMGRLSTFLSGEPETVSPSASHSPSLRRMSSCGSAGAMSDSGSALDAVVMIDWDDTLLPTTHLRESVMPGLAKNECNLPLPAGSQQYQALASHAQIVKQLLRNAATVARVAIVTLATRNWVFQSAERYLPDLDLEALISELDITIYHADRYASFTRVSAFFWGDAGVVAKKKEMAKCLKALYAEKNASSRRNVLSIGDSTTEKEAIKDLMGKGALCKTVKLNEKPSLVELGYQLCLVSPLLGDMVRDTKPFDKTPIDMGFVGVKKG
eukprot:TRINITY_DN32629_c0_g1_i1.p1 TRINITY_DN32629_c0_g1~~TRINITY_DN32629_c0_g1_i1.p1  ORF type:complete len:635 (+),score=82.73 TRINITY_DN32629_c0_g1_i1:65-1906(+)